MKEIIKNLFVGNENDVGEVELRELAIVHACKEPFHRQLLGYTGRGAPKDHPEYLWAERKNRLYMNIVDAPKSIFFDKGMIDKALDFIHEKLNQGFKVLVHCNEGFSRSPSIALLYLVKHKYIDVDTLEDAEAEFLKLYPEYNPGTGMRGFVKENWNCYNTPF
ncbi:dual specificity protein phosphatase family protein [Tissierella pigra]|uniref:Dual specificity protein phosphatase family protein n=1 Tax=Tissierella pigra TaxID=2607614 RepID=A0A6N7XIT5_9FIRM|nr:dual specificity protein phosphatase [Tissierella pigra]MSU01949.1 dual specificity protein phosphatase family protein [Tissierella pigra]